MHNQWLTDLALDRSALKRREARWLEVERARASNRLVLVWRDRVMVQRDATGPRMATVSVVDSKWSPRITGPKVLLAEHEGGRLFAAEVDPELQLEEEAQFENHRSLGLQIRETVSPPQTPQKPWVLCQYTIALAYASSATSASRI